MSIILLITVIGVVGLLVVPAAADLATTYATGRAHRRARRRHSLEARRFHHDALDPGFRGRAA